MEPVGLETVDFRGSQLTFRQEHLEKASNNNQQPPAVCDISGPRTRSEGVATSYTLIIDNIILLETTIILNSYPNLNTLLQKWTIQHAIARRTTDITSSVFIFAVTVLPPLIVSFDVPHERFFLLCTFLLAVSSLIPYVSTRMQVWYDVHRGPLLMLMSTGRAVLYASCIAPAIFLSEDSLQRSNTVIMLVLSGLQIAAAMLVFPVTLQWSRRKAVIIMFPVLVFTMQRCRRLMDMHPDLGLQYRSVVAHARRCTAGWFYAGASVNGCKSDLRPNRFEEDVGACVSMHTTAQVSFIAL
jgi:hypothetical protein